MMMDSYFCKIVVFVLFCSYAVSAQMFDSRLPRVPYALPSSSDQRREAFNIPRNPRVPYRLPTPSESRREAFIPRNPRVPYRLPSPTESWMEGTSLSGLRRRLLERLAVNRQFQQMASAPPGPKVDITPQSGISNMLDSILSLRSQRQHPINQKQNTQVLTRGAAIQNLQRRFGGQAGGALTGDLGFQNQQKEPSMFGGGIFGGGPRTTPAAPKANIQLSITRSTSTKNAGLRGGFMNQAPSLQSSTFGSSASGTGFPRSNLGSSSTNSLISSRPSFQNSQTASSLSSPSRSSSSASSLNSVLSASTAINTAAAARGQLSDMMDSRMDFLSDMAEAGMMGGMGGLGGFGGFGGMGGMGGMGNMFGSGFGGGGGGGLFGGFGSLAFL